MSDRITANPKQVLVAGYRPQIATRLHQLGLEFVIWHDRPIKKTTIPGCIRVIDEEPFGTHIPSIKRRIERLFAPGARFKQVIAGTESSVVAASVARRALSGRRSKDTVVLRCHNKRMMKEFMRDKGIPLIPFRYSGDRIDGRPITATDVLDELGLPLVVKQLDNSGGRGLAIVRRAEQIEPYLKQKVLFETFVDAPETSVETFVSKRAIRFTSTTRYVEKTFANLVPSGHPAALEARLLELNRKVLNALDIEWGLTHAEYYLAGDRIYFGEIALRPPGGYIMELISLAHDFDAWHAFVDNELGLEPAFAEPTRWAAAVLFHPGGGRIESIVGEDRVRSIPSCKKLYFHSRVGEHLGPREGVSQVAAFALFRAETRAEALDAIRHAQQDLVFEMKQM